MKTKPKTKRFLGRTLMLDMGAVGRREGSCWHSPPAEGPWVTIGDEGSEWVIIVWTHSTRIDSTAPTERAARNAMVRKLRRLRDELSELEF